MSKLINKEMKIMIVEDHPIFRYGLSELINNQDTLTVCGDADNASDALRKIPLLDPDLIIIDLSLKDSSGMELLNDISKHYKKIPVLILSMHEKPHYADRVLKMGAMGYVTKHETYDSIIHAIHKVFSGERYVSQIIADGLIEKMINGEQKNIIDILTSREIEIFECIGKGMKTKKISEYLCISNNTVNTYRERIKTKLNLTDSMELVKCAIEWIQKDNNENI